MSAGKLFCNACRDEISEKASVLKSHLQSEKHSRSKQRLLAKEARERDIATSLQDHQQGTHLEGESLSVSQQVYRVKVLTAFLHAVIPLAKVGCFRQILEGNALRLTDCNHLANLIPFVLQEEQTRLNEEIKDKRVSVIFDGTTRLGVYRLEGDGPLALECYEIISATMEGVQVANYPNIEGVAKKVSGGSQQVQQQLVAYARDAVRPGLDYLVSTFTGTLKPAMDKFKLARFFSPHKVIQLQPDDNALDSLQVLPFLDSTTIVKLKEELPAYLADISPELSPLAWWKLNYGSLPTWAAVTQQVLLIQPSSAASERVFSLPSNAQQLSSLQDYVEV